MSRIAPPRVSQLGPAISWLLAKDVSSTRLASLFGTTPENIRVSAFRSRRSAQRDEFAEPALSDQPTADEAAMVGVRQEPDEVVLTPRKIRKLDELRSEIEQVVSWHSQNYRFVDAAPALRQLAPLIGFAGEVNRKATAALLHQHMAWFSVHSGRSDSAVREAQTSRALWRTAYHESPKKEYAEHFIQAALIGSQALLLERRPHEAWTLLDTATDAARSIGASEGSDFARQRGVVLLQLREDERAAKEFRKSADLMDKLNEARVPAQLLMTGARHLSVLSSPNFDEALKVLEAVRHDFGPGSLEVAMAVHWSAACGLLIDSKGTCQNALDLLQSGPDTGPEFGHQLTVRRLLALTPELGLDHRLRRMWVRRTLYENAFRNS